MTGRRSAQPPGRGLRDRGPLPLIPDRECRRGPLRRGLGEAGVRAGERRLRREPVDEDAAYIETLPLFSQGRMELLDHPRLVRELQCLERRTRAGGKNVVDHPRGGHDDYANVTTLAALAALEGTQYMEPWEEWFDPEVWGAFGSPDVPSLPWPRAPVTG